MATKLRGSARVGYTVFELDKIPEDDIPRYKSLTEVWTTSNGKPCIATNYSAPTEFINEHNCYLLSPGRLISAVDPEFSLDGNQERWADPPKEELKVLMRKVFEHREEAHRLEQEAARQMENWTWNNAAQIVSTYIEELEERYGLKGEATE